MLIGKRPMPSIERLLLSRLHKQEAISFKKKAVLRVGLQNFHLFWKWYSGKSKAITDFLAFICSAGEGRMVFVAAAQVDA